MHQVAGMAAMDEKNAVEELEEIVEFLEEMVSDGPATRRSQPPPIPAEAQRR